MRGRFLLILALSIHACVSGGETSSDDNPINAAGSAGSGAGSGGGSGGVPPTPDGTADGDPCPFKEYKWPGCGVNEPAPYCGAGVAGACAGSWCGCDGITFSSNCGFSHLPHAYQGPCLDGGDADDASDGDACVWLYDAPGCGSNAPAPLCTDGKDDACALPFCGCDGVTFLGGCGKSNVPFAAYGPCQGDGG
jgi:hypothetical protein